MPGLFDERKKLSDAVPRHPGAGRRKTNPFPKGRPTDPAALEEIRGLLGTLPRNRDLLIEHLHLIQDRFGRIPERLLAALAKDMHLAPAEVYEVATFYAHFDVIGDNETPPPPLTVRVCDGLSCAMAGGRELLADLQHETDGTVRVVRGPCMGRCENAPVAAVGHAYLTRATVQSVTAAAEAGDTAIKIGPYTEFDAYRAGGGYSLLQACLDGKRCPEEVIGTLGRSGLRGLGGAGFPAGQKWRLVRQEPAPRLMVVNADEGEPGTFKDRHHLESDPHRLIEGALIGAWAVEAEAVYIYVRDEYPEARAILAREISRAREAGLVGPAIHLRRGAGAYICGEESAMLESIEGKRGLPRHKPPFPSQVGLFGRPTLINNVETLCWVRDIVERGADWFAAQGVRGCKGLRSFSVSGRVNDPGVKLAPAGTTARELIDDHCGGMQPGHTFKGYLPGGASGGILPAAMADLPLDFGTLEEHGCFIGSAAVIVLSDHDRPADVALNLMRFFEDESCGQCTPCRVGTEKAALLLERETWDNVLLQELVACMRDASICGLGQAAGNSYLSLRRHFPEDGR